MKGKEIINHAIRAEMPDMEQLRENCVRQATEKTTVRRSVWVKRIVSAAACFVVLLAAVIAFPHFTNDEIKTPGAISSEVSDKQNSQVIDYIIRGLPVENFNLADIESSVTTKRIGFSSFGSFFEYGANCFAIVKITGTQILDAEYETERINKFGEEFDIEHQINPKRQISDVKVLKSIYGECKSDTIQIIQTVFENHFCLGTTNLLRKDGVYLLPLQQSDGNWYVVGDMDVLFEVDDQGKVWSHSSFEDFIRYDGKNVEYFTNELQNIFSNDDFMLANSPFSGILRDWTLADITISAKSDEKTDKNGYHYFSYAFTVNEILSTPDHNDAASLKETGDITVYADEADTIKLLPGNRYLICLDRYEGKTSVNPLMIASIGNDDTITATPAPDNYTSVFTPYNGNKIVDIRDLVSRINSWREAHG